MNQDQFLGMLRSLIAVGGGIAVAHGTLNDSQVTQIGGIAASLVPFVWSFFAHTDSAKIAAVTALPDVKKIVTTPVPSNSAVAAAANDPSQTKVAPSL